MTLTRKPPPTPNSKPRATGSVPAPKGPPRLPGAWRAPRKVAGGVRVHWYAWRGGDAPKLGAFFAATVEEADAAAWAALPELAAARRAALRGETGAGPATLADLCKRYETSPDFTRLAASTQDRWGRTLVAVATDPVVGRLSLRALERPAATTLLLDWRDAFAATPRKADYLLQVTRRVLAWGVARRFLTVNALEGAQGIYVSDRAKVVWSDGEVARVQAAGTPELADALAFLRLTGLRRGDACRAAWTGVDRDAGVLVVRTGKGRRSRPGQVKVVEQVCELTPALLALLDRLPVRGATILTTSRGRAWTPDGLESSFLKARAKAAIPPGPDGKPKRLHDLRGTTATERVAAALERDDVRQALGWTKGEAGAAKAYVDAATVVALRRRRKAT